MLKKTITYKDLDGNDVVEDFYFNLTKAEIAEMEMSQDGGFGAHLKTLIATQNGEQIIKTFKKILTSAIGRRSEDGKRFVKNQEIVDDFLQSDAYNQLFMEFLENPNAAADFVKGIVPQDMLGKMEAIEQEEAAKNGDERPLYMVEDREPTQKELTEMSPDELRQAFAWRQQKRKEPGTTE